MKQTLSAKVPFPTETRTVTMTLEEGTLTVQDSSSENHGWGRSTSMPFGRAAFFLLSLPSESPPTSDEEDDGA